MRERNAAAQLKAYLSGVAGETGAGYGHSARMDLGLPADPRPAKGLQLRLGWGRAAEYERLQEAIDSRTIAIRNLRQEIRALRSEQGKLMASVEEGVDDLGQSMKECGGGLAEGEEGIEGEGDSMGRRGDGVLKKWQEYAAWRVDWRENGVAPDPRIGLSCRQCGLRDSKEDPRAFSGKVRKRYTDLMAGTQRHGRPIFCSTCTDNRRVQEEEADAWVASLRKVTCMDCDKILTVEELSLTQRKKALVNKRCKDCARVRERERTQVGSSEEVQSGDGVGTSDDAAGEHTQRRRRGSGCRVASC